MSLKRSILFIGSGVLVLLILVFLFFHHRFSRNPDEPMKAIPLDAGIILQVNNFNHLIQDLGKSQVWGELSKIEELTKLQIQANFLDSLARANKTVKSLLNIHPFYISFHATGKNSMNLIYILKIPKGVAVKEIAQIIKNLVENSGTIKSRKYDGTEIFDIRLLNESVIKNFSYSISNGLLIFSFSSLLVEDALRQLTLTESIYSNREFNKVFETTGKNVDANIFINYNQVPKLIAIHLRSDYTSRMRLMKDMASWAALDLNLQDETILLNGFTYVNDSAKQLMKLFLHQSPEKMTIDDVLPATISSFLALNLSDEELYFQKFRNHLLDKGKLNEYNKNISILKSKYNIDLNESFYSQIDKEIAVAFEATNSDKLRTNKFVIIKVKSKSLAEKKLSGLIDKVATVKRTSSKIYKFNYKIDDELSFPIYKIPLEQFLNSYLGGLYGYFDGDYFTFYDNYLIFGNSVESLSQFIHSNVLNRTLITNLSYREFRNNLSPRSTLVFYSDLGKSLLNYSEFLLPEIIHQWEANIDVFQKVQDFGFQLSPQKDFLYTSFFLKEVSEVNDKPRTVWESLLDTVIDFKPQFVINHNTKQTEIFLQDCNNTIYLMNQVGRILWKQNIPEKINSSIYQIDYYSNNKLQLLFSTKNYLHLIDRNGNYVERYPVKLRAPATNGMALFDYENTKDYRIFIACGDNKVYAYKKDGSIVKGWEPENTESEVNQPVNHFRIKNKDYIVYGDRLRTYILDRRGKTRVDVKELIPRSINNNYYLESNGDLNNSFIAFTDTSGTIYKVFFDERIEKLQILHCSPDHYFDFKDMDGDGNNDYIFLDHNKLSVFKQDKSELLTFSADVSIDLPPGYYQFSAKDRKIGLVSKKKYLIFLINNDGSIYKGFPLKGSTLFSIGYLGNTVSHFNLITGGENNFLYNYTVQ